MSSISVTTFGVRLIDGGCIYGPVPGFLLPDPEVGPDVGNGYSETSSNISCFNEGFNCRLGILR